MLFTIDYWKKESYLPTKRHGNLRERYVKDTCDVEIKEVATEKFPIAFRIHKYESVYKNAKSYDDFNGNGEFKMFCEEIRTYNGNLYKPVRISHGAAISTNFESLDYIKKSLTDYKPYWDDKKDFSEKSIIKSDNAAECEENILHRAEQYIIYNGVVWKTCGEPMYNITKFGLGYNHGGTGFFITYSYNPNINKNNYFNALEREKAIAYGKKVALNRGDTDSIEGMGDNDIIEVLIPEMVKRNPQEER